MKQMFDIWKVESRTIRWDFRSDSNWMRGFFIETVVFGQWWRSHQPLACKVMYFQISVLCLGKVNQNPTSNIAWEQQFELVQKIHHNSKLWIQLTENRRNSSGKWDIFRGFITLQLVQEVQKFMTEMGEPSQFKGRIIFMSMFNDILWRIKTKKRNAMLTPRLCVNLQKKKKIPSWTLVILRTWIRKEVVFYLYWQTMRRMGSSRWIWWWSKFGESGHPVFRATSLLSRGMLKSKGGGKLSLHFCADGDTIETLFRTLISGNQLCIYGAVSDLCEEYITCQTSTERPVLAGQFVPLFAPANFLIMTRRPSIEILAQENLLQKYRQRVEKLPTRSID